MECERAARRRGRRARSGGIIHLSPCAFDRQRLTEIGHGDAPYWNPVGPEALDVLLAALAPRPGERVLDVGCGPAGMLIDLLERSGATGVGVDANPRAIERARAAGARRLPAGALALHAEPFDVSRWPRGGFDVVLCVGALHAAGGLEPALAAFAQLLADGGRMLIGEGHWKREPDPAYLDWIGAARDEMRSLEATRDAFLVAGFEVTATHVTSAAEWDAYERGYRDRIVAHADAHPDDPEARAMREHVLRWHEGYRRWGHDTLGFALHLLRGRERGMRADPARPPGGPRP